MVGDIIEVLSKLGEFSDRLKQADSEQREKISSYFSRVGQCLKEIAQKLKTGELPYSKISELREIAERLPEAIGDEISQDKANELSELLKNALGDRVDDLKDNDRAIRQIQECAGKFDGIAFTIKYPQKKYSGDRSPSIVTKQKFISIGLVLFSVVVGVSAWFLQSRQSSEPTITDDPTYQPLALYIKNRDWKSADRETTKTLLEAANNAIPDRGSRIWLDRNDIKEIPCEDIKTINQLWSVPTNNQFGLVTQSRIWQESGGTTIAETVESQVRKEFSKRIGWKDADKPDKFTLDKLYKELDKHHQKNLDKIDRGYLPSAIGQYEDNTIYVGEGNEFAALTAKLQECEIQ